MATDDPAPLVRWHLGLHHLGFMHKHRSSPAFKLRLPRSLLLRAAAITLRPPQEIGQMVNVAKVFRGQSAAQDAAPFESDAGQSPLRSSIFSTLAKTERAHSSRPEPKNQIAFGITS